MSLSPSGLHIVSFFVHSQLSSRLLECSSESELGNSAYWILSGHIVVSPKRCRRRRNLHFRAVLELVCDLLVDRGEHRFHEGQIGSQEGDLHLLADGKVVGMDWRSVPTDKALWGVAEVHLTKLKLEVQGKYQKSTSKILFEIPLQLQGTHGSLLHSAMFIQTAYVT